MEVWSRTMPASTSYSSSAVHCPAQRGQNTGSARLLARHAPTSQRNKPQSTCRRNQQGASANGTTAQGTGALGQRAQKRRVVLQAAVGEGQVPPAPSLQEALKQVDKLLGARTAETEAEALAIIRTLSTRGVAKAFGRGQQVPKRTYTLDELRLNKIEPAKYLSPEDNTLNGVRNIMQGAALAGLSAAYFGDLLNFGQLAQVVIVAAFALTVDQVVAGGGFEAMAIDTAGRIVSNSYAKRVALHEAGHFLVAYLLGLLPSGYTLSALDAYLKARQLNVQAGCTFCDGEFQKEVASGKLRGSSLGTYACVALAGVATEYLRFGQAEGGRGDVNQLDALLRALQFSQKKAESEVRWAVINTALLLRRHAKVQDELAAAMGRGASVGECCAIIEAGVREEELAPRDELPGVNQDLVSQE